MTKRHPGDLGEWFEAGRDEVACTFLQHLPMDTGYWDDVLEAFKLPNDHGSVCFVQVNERDSHVRTSFDIPQGQA